jgi:UDP-N-acetylmuramate dehydrogenase
MKIADSIFLQENVSLQPYNTFGIAAKARFFVVITQIEQLKTLIASSFYQQNNKLILGGGSNILFTQDFDGLVIKIETKGIEKIQEDEHSVWLKVAAGENWHQFVMHCVENGWGGVENLSLIPGTVGAAPMQNIGAYGVEVKNVIESVQYLDKESGKIQSLANQDCLFGYRESIFKHDLKNKVIITEVVFRLSKQTQLQLHYGGVQEELAAMGIVNPTLQDVSKAICAIRQKKLPNPAVIGNAGSFFKNPEITTEKLQQLQQNYSTIPYFETVPQYVKIPAAWLIEQCGWKGKTWGNAGVSPTHALVLINATGKASGQEVQTLAQEIQQSVQEKFDITIQPEVNWI